MDACASLYVFISLFPERTIRGNDGCICHGAVCEKESEMAQMGVCLLRSRISSVFAVLSGIIRRTGIGYVCARRVEMAERLGFGYITEWRLA